MLQFWIMKKENTLKILVATILATGGWLLAVYVSGFFEADSTAARLVFGAVVSSFVLALVAVLYRFEGRKARLDFDLPKHLKLFGVGFLWFAVPALVTLVIASLLGWLEIGTLGPPLEIAGTVLLVAGLVALSEAIPEEVIMRGYVFSKLSKLGGRWFTVFAQAAIFTLFAFMIGALDSPLDASFIFTFGMALGILRSATGSIATSIGFHLACMTFQQTFTSRWGVFEASNSDMLQMYVFGMIPLSAVTAFFVTKMLNAKP